MGAGLRANGRNPTLSRLILRPGRLVRRGVASVLMLQKMMAKVFGTKNDREIKKIQPIVVAVNSFEAKMAALSDAELQGLTAIFRGKLDQGATTDDILPEAFAACREAGRRVLGMRHYDVQIVGGHFLHTGTICEMRTGEGKTLVATLPAYLNALTGKGVHVVTVNDYLAQRDCEWMSRLYNYMGLSTGVIHTGAPQSERKRAYNADITYGQNNELGFDYLRDNMKFSLSDYVHRYLPTAHDPKAEKLLHYAIVDEVDSILIDEARTPLIISGTADESIEPYLIVNGIMPFLKRDLDFSVDEKSHSVALTEAGVDKVEARLKVPNLFAPDHMHWVHYIHAGLKSHNLYRADVNYVVEGGKVIIIDEHTGRKMPGRRWSDGIHQAIEAKEGLRVQEETQTLATITFQNYFRMYEKLSGMTGTAETEAEEFAKVYDMDTIVIPTNRPVIRDDREDLVYKNERGKFKAVLEEIAECNEAGQPVLVGTISVEKSQFLSHLLDERGIKHHVLNAKQHGAEAEIIAQAGRLGSVTIATNMAGRGTDIILGGNAELRAKYEVFGVSRAQQEVDEDDPTFRETLTRYVAESAVEKQQVLDAGGLAVIGTERHESRRIDNQLRGRSGRQGDPGMSQFYLSLEDDLMRIFNGDRVAKIMEWLDIPEDEPIVARSVSKAIESSQMRVEGQNFDARKNLLDYDNVMNQQRKTIYALRRSVMGAADPLPLLEAVIDEVVYSLIDQHCPQSARTSDWDVEGLEDAIYKLTGLDIELDAVESDFDRIEAAVVGALLDEYKDRRVRMIETVTHSLDPVDADDAIDEAELNSFAFEQWAFFERETYLRGIDNLWKDHLRAMDALKEGVYLRAYAQKDPKLVYKKEGFDLFHTMIVQIQRGVVETLFHVEVKSGAEIEAMRNDAEARRARAAQRVQETHVSADTLHDAAARGGAGDSGVSVPGASSPMIARSPEPASQVVTMRRTRPKIGRNDPCWCGSGNKYKKCHMSGDEGVLYDDDPPPELGAP
jgi:preprotein translocase subunit SecA